jgi:hypothetical protein
MRPLAAFVWCAVLLSFASPRPGECTQAPLLDPGARVRFDAPSLGGQLTGTLVAWESDRLVVRVDGDAPGLSLIVPTDSVTRLDVRHERSMTLAWTGVGVLAGSLLAVVADPNSVDENGNCSLACLAYEVSPRLDKRLAILSVAGAVLGAIVGAGSKTETWATVPLTHVRLDATQNGGLALGVRLSF